MSVIHHFSDSLKLSQSQIDAPWWAVIYKKAFPTMKAMISIDQDRWSQRAGVDRIIILNSEKDLRIEEKVREKDWNDILLEYLSDAERNIPGWIEKDLASDFIIFVFKETQRAFLLPFPLLRRCWKQHGKDWIQKAELEEEGYRKVIAENGKYRTVSVAVSWNVLCEALIDATVLYWSNDPSPTPTRAISGLVGVKRPSAEV